MGWVEIIVVAAMVGVIFIVVRRLPATKHLNVPVRESFNTRRETHSSKQLLSVDNYRINAFNLKVLAFLGMIREWFTKWWGKLLGLFKGIRKKPIIEKEVISGLKKPEDRAFWGEEHKSGVGMATPAGGTYFEQAEDAFKRQDFRRAEAMYLQAVRENPKNARVFNRLGIIYLDQKKYEDAIESFVAALKGDDNVASRHFNLGLAYLGQGNYQDAIFELKRAIELCPENDKYTKVLEEAQKK